MKFKVTFFTSGLLLSIFGLLMLIPCAVEYGQNMRNAEALFLSSLACLFFGGIMILANRSPFESFNVREGFLLTTISWLFISLAGALPLWLSDIGVSFTDAYFESISGFTTTGSTILVGLDSMPQGILLWRSMLQWIGGIGIIAFGIVLLPFLKIGGMQLFQTESSDRHDKTLPKSRQLVSRLMFIYAGLTSLCFLAYLLNGMSVFDALNHSMTTLSTGGYSTHDASFGHFQNPTLYVTATFFMLLGGLPFVLYIKYLQSGHFAFHKDEQVKGFLAIIILFVVPIVIWQYIISDMGLGQVVVLTLFNVVSVLTTTGFATDDYTLWGTPIVALFFFMTYLGGCAGSTSGGMKTMRIVIILRVLKVQLQKLLYPNGVFTPQYQGYALNGSTITAVMVFLALYVALNVVLTLALILTGLDPETAISGAATAIANVGPGIGQTIGPAGNFSTLPDAAKWLLCLGMFLGRLEILTVLVLFSPYYWRD